jgi:hypothetical protein
MSGDKCQWCRFWGASVQRDGADFRQFDCRRHAPIFHEIRDGGYIRQQSWPQTKHDDWCGDFDRLQSPIPVSGR